MPFTHSGESMGVAGLRARDAPRPLRAFVPERLTAGPSVLFRPAQGALKAAALAAAQALFLWMFLAADPLEQLATAGAFGADPGVRDWAFVFAADWRHGMTQNSPLYMPGFFAVAAAVWIWSETVGARLWRSFVTALAAAFAIACAAAPAGTAAVLASFHVVSGMGTSRSVPFASAGAMFAATYTLLNWTVFVLGCRAAVARRSLLPLAPTPFLTAGLIALRPWTVGHFTNTWWTRSLEGDPTAIMSAALIPLLAAFLVGRTRRCDTDL